MQASALAESVLGDFSFKTLPSAQAYPKEDIVMALPVDVSDVPGDDNEYLKSLAQALKNSEEESTTATAALQRRIIRPMLPCLVRR